MQFPSLDIEWGCLVHNYENVSMVEISRNLSCNRINWKLGQKKNSIQVDDTE